MRVDQRKLSSNSIKSIFLLLIGTIGGAGFSFLSQILFARQLNPYEYGILASSLVTVTMLLPIAGFGIGQFWLRVFGIEGFSAQRWIGPSLRLVALSTLIACIIYVLWSSYSKQQSSDALVWWLVPLVISYALVELVTARLQLEERYSFLAVWQAVPHFSRFIVALALTAFGGALRLVGIGFFFHSRHSNHGWYISNFENAAGPTGA